MSLRGLWFALPLLTLSTACGPDAVESTGNDDTTDDADDADDSGTGDDAGDDGDADDAGDDTAADSETTGTDGTTDGDTGEDTGTTPPSGVLARHIAIDRIDFNPGVAVPVAGDGREATPEERYARIPKDRDAWVHIEVDIDEANWTPRQIQAVITLERDGTTIQADQIKTIERDTDEWQDDPEGGYESVKEQGYYEGFYFGIPASEMQPGLHYRVDLYEVDDSMAGTPEPVDPPSLPPEQDVYWDVQVEETELEMRVMIVPIQYDDGGCQAIMDTSEENIARYRDEIFAMNPVSEVELTVHDPYPWNGPITSGNHMGQVLNAMSQLKAQENADPNIYYYAIFNNCGQCVPPGPGEQGCIAGMANLTGASLDTGEGNSRVGTGIPSVGTYVHEVGHNQGRSHVGCAGTGSAGNDPSYPYFNGTLGSWGFNLNELFFYHPDLGYDYMSYCGPSWVSNWQWEATWERIAVLTSFNGDVASPHQLSGSQDAPQPAEEELVYLSVGETLESWTTPGHLDQDRRSADHQVHLYDGDTLVTTQAARIIERDHMDGYVAITSVPAGTQITRVELKHDGETHVSALGKRIGH